MNGGQIKALKRAYWKMIHERPDGAPVMPWRSFKRAVIAARRSQ